MTNSGLEPQPDEGSGDTTVVHPEQQQRGRWLFWQFLGGRFPPCGGCNMDLASKPAIWPLRLRLDALSRRRFLSVRTHSHISGMSVSPLPS